MNNVSNETLIILAITLLIAIIAITIMSIIILAKLYKTEIANSLDKPQKNQKDCVAAGEKIQAI